MAGDYLAFSEGAVSQPAPASSEESEQTTDWYIREIKAAGERDLARQVLLEEISEEAWSGRDGQVHAQARKFRQIAANKADELANELRAGVHREKLMASRFVNMRMGHDDRELQREKESNQVLLAKMRDVELELQAKESECLAAVSHSRMLQERVWSLEHDMSTLQQTRTKLDETRADMTRSESNMRVLQEQNLHLRVELEGLLKSSQTSRSAHQALTNQVLASPGVGVSALGSGVESSGFVCGEEHDAIVGELMDKVRRLEMALAEGASSPAIPDTRRRTDPLPSAAWAAPSRDAGQRMDAGRSTGPGSHLRGSGRGSGRGEREKSYGDDLVVVLSSSIDSSSSSIHVTNNSFDEDSPRPRQQLQTLVCYHKAIQTNYAERSHQSVQTTHAQHFDSPPPRHRLHAPLCYDEAVQTSYTERSHQSAQTTGAEGRDLECQTVQTGPTVDMEMVVELEALLEIARAELQGAELKLEAAEREVAGLGGQLRGERARAEQEAAARAAENARREEEAAARQRVAEEQAEAAAARLRELEEEAAKEAEREEEGGKECCVQARMAEAEEWSERLAWEEMERQAADAALYEAVAERDAVMKARLEEAEASQQDTRRIRLELEKLEVEVGEARREADGERGGRELLHRELQDRLQELDTLRRRKRGMEEEADVERSIVSRRLDVLDDKVGSVEGHLSDMGAGLHECGKARGEALVLRSELDAGLRACATARGEVAERQRTCDALLEQVRSMEGKEQAVQGLTNGLHALLFAILEAERDLSQARLDHGRLVNELVLKDIQLRDANASLANALARAEELQQKQSSVREDWEGMVVTTQRLEKDRYHQERLLAIAHDDFQAATEAGQHVAEQLAGSRRRLEAVTSELARRRKREQQVTRMVRMLWHWKGFLVWERVRSTLAHLARLRWLRAFMARVARRWFTWSTRKRRMRDFFKARQELLAHTSFGACLCLPHQVFSRPFLLHIITTGTRSSPVADAWGGCGQRRCSGARSQRGARARARCCGATSSQAKAAPAPRSRRSSCACGGSASASASSSAGSRERQQRRCAESAAETATNPLPASSPPRPPSTNRARQRRPRWKARGRRSEGRAGEGECRGMSGAWR